MEILFYSGLVGHSPATLEKRIPINSGFFAKGDDLNEIVDGLKVISSCGQSAFIVGKKAIEHFRTAVGKSEPS